MMQSSHIFIAINPVAERVVFIDCDGFDFKDDRFTSPSWWTCITVKEYVDSAFADLVNMIANPEAYMPLDPEDAEPTYPMRGGHAAYDA